MTDWNIQSRAHACEACGKHFVDKQSYHTLLFDEKAAFRRLDICQACWEKQYSDGARDRKGFVSYWQGMYEAPPPPSEPIQKETAESLLRKLIELNDPRYIPAGYILAVMLERKRLLKVKEEMSRDGRRIFVYEQPKTGDLFTIIDPQLQLTQLEAVQHDVAQLLEHGLNAPGTNPEDRAPPLAPNPSDPGGAGSEPTPSSADAPAADTQPPEPEPPAPSVSEVGAEPAVSPRDPPSP